MEEGSDAPFSKNFVVSSPIIHNHSAEMQQDTSHPLQSVKPTDPILNSFFMNAHATNITNSTSDTSSTYDLQRPSSSLQEEIPYQNTRFCISLPSRINVIERGPSCIHLLPPPCQSSWWHQLQTKFKLIPWFIWLYGITFLLLSSLFIFNYKLLLIWIHTLSTKLVEMHIL